MFTQHRANAKQRGVPFLFTFVEWWNVWESSGKWSQRGHHADQYCMSRFGDRGAYEVGNVFIQTASDNMRETLGIKRTPEQNAARSEFMKGKTNGLGGKRTPEIREKMRKAQRARRDREATA